MNRSLLMPDIAPGPQPMRVVQWLADVGSELLVGDRLVEIATGGVLFSVHSPWSGRLVRIEAVTDATVTVGSPLAMIDSQDDDE